MASFPTNAGTPSKLSFGLFEIDLKSGELWKAGYRVKLQMQPFKVLTVLLEHAGEVVSREEIQLRVWGPDVNVDFEHSLGGAMKKVREALGDSAENPRFIETLARRGYRFIAPVGFASPSGRMTSSTPLIVEPPSPMLGAAPSPSPAAAQPVSVSRRSPHTIYLLLAAALGAGTMALGVLGWNWRHPLPAMTHISQITQDGQVYSPGEPAVETMPASAIVGSRLFTSTIDNGRVVLSQISIATGESHELALPAEITSPEITDLSPDGTELLVRSHLAAASEQPLWIVPIDGGSAFRVFNIQVLDATWMPSGKEIVYSSNNQLSTISVETGRSSKFAEVPGRAFWMRWSPDAKILRFTLIDPLSHVSSLWQIAASDRVPHPLPRKWSTPADECCGTWSADGKLFVFQATKDGVSDLWRLNGDSTENPALVTNGPLAYEGPAAGRDPDKEQIFFVGRESRARLEQYDAVHKTFVPLPAFLSNARRITYSRDGHWVAWTNPLGSLWRSRTDGTDMVRLSPESLDVFLASWSPDGSRLALMARYLGQTWQIYTISASGGSPEAVLQENRNVGDPSYSPDGKRIVFGRVPDLMGQDNTLRPLEFLELATGQRSAIANSQGFFSPRWSPDGRYIAALTLDQKNVMLYDVAAGTWKLLVATSAADPVWSADSRSLYVHAFSMTETEPIVRIRVPDGKVDEVLNLKSFATGANQYLFAGISPDGLPLLRAETSSGNLYMTDLRAR